VGGLESEGEGGGHGAPGEGFLLLADPEGAVEPEVYALFGIVAPYGALIAGSDEYSRIIRHSE
jgi:hypothetical protein